MFGNRENISSCSSIIINTYYPFNCVFRKCFSSFFIPKEEEDVKKEGASVVDCGKKDATSEREIGDTGEEEDKEEDKEEESDFPIILYILSYFWVGAFTKSFIFGTVSVDLKKPNRWCTKKINIIEMIEIWIIQLNILYWNIS